MVASSSLNASVISLSVLPGLSHVSTNAFNASSVVMMLLAFATMLNFEINGSGVKSHAN